MIYLIKTSMLVINDENDMDKDEVIPVLKIGYSEDSRGNGRFNDYMSNGFVIRIIKTIPGGSWNLEHTLQRKFKDYKLPGKSIEWFYYTDEIVQLFLKCNNDVDLYSLFGATNEEELKKVQYKSRSNVYKTKHEFDEIVNRVSEEFPDDLGLIEFVNDLSELTKFADRMKLLCDFCNNSTDEIIGIVLQYLPDDFRLYYESLGATRIKALEYRREYLIKEINNIKKKCDNITVDRIVQSFKVGEKYPRNVIKEELSKIYSDLDITKAPKASDLSEYFDIKPCTINTNVGGERQRVNGYEILGLKKND